MSKTAGPKVLKFVSGPPARKQFGERFRLVVKSEKNLCYCLLADHIVIGREDGCDIVLIDPKVSRKHLELKWNGRSYVAKDLGSPNNFLHNGNKVTEANLEHSDSVVIGVTVLEMVGVDAQGRSLLAKTNGPSPSTISKQMDLASKVSRNKLLVGLGLLLILLAIFSEPEGRIKTFRERSKIEIAPEIEKKQNQNDDAVEAARRKARAAAQQAELAAQKVERAINTKDPEKAIEVAREAAQLASKAVEAVDQAESARKIAAPISELGNGQLNGEATPDADVFYRAGMRELQNKNFRRALTNFDTALSVNPDHDLAKVYKEITKRQFEKDVDAAMKAAIRAKRSLRYREARMNYETVLRFLEGDRDNLKYVEAQEAINELNRIDQGSR